jgi:hypothetical protein
MSQKATSLTDDAAEEKFFYIAIGDNTNSDSKLVIYKINHNHIHMLPLFKSMVAMNPTGSSTPATAIHIKPVYIRDDCKKNAEFWINTSELFDVIMNYIDIWKDPKKIDDENYVKPDIVQTGYINQILKQEDIKLILDYVQLELNKLPVDVQCIMENNLTIKKHHIISCMNPLLKMVDGFIQMDGFSNKIYAYIATILWNCSLMDLDDVSEEPYFRQLQQRQLAEWNRRNADQINFVVASDGDVNVNVNDPNLDLDLDD